MAKNVKKSKPKVKAVVMPKAGVVQFVVPAKIAPLPVARKRSWWQRLFLGD